jgi:hypothetical protein
MLFRVILSFLILLTLSCSEGDVPVNLTRSQISELLTTTHLLGSFTGDRSPSLQQDNLEPGEYTIQFQIVEPPTDGLGFATYAYIVWKIGGQQISRIISVFNGSAISGIADSVHVQLLDQSGRGEVSLQGTFSVTNGSPSFTSSVAQTLKSGQLIQFDSQPGVFYSVPNGMLGTSGVLDAAYTGVTDGAAEAFSLSKYKVAAALSKGTRPTTMQPPVLFTQNEKNAGPGANLTVIFPFDAGIISVLATVIVNGNNTQEEAANGTLSFFDDNGFTLTAFIPSSFPAWYPVPPGSVSMVFSNHSGDQTLNFSYQWGIEG